MILSRNVPRIVAKLTMILRMLSEKQKNTQKHGLNCAIFARVEGGMNDERKN